MQSFILRGNEHIYRIANKLNVEKDASYTSGIIKLIY